MSSAKPAEPQPVGKDQPSTPQWLFLFYKWVTGALAGLFPGTAGNVIYSDGAGGVANEDAFNYNSSTNTLNVDSILVDVGLNVGEMGTEGSGVTINGTAYTAHLKVSDINDSHLAHTILHRHSTTLPATLVAARSNSSGSSHAAVTSGQSLFQIYAVGHDGTDYAFSSAIDFAVDGTPGSNDMPGRIGFFTAADGGQTLTERFRISNFGGLGIGGANFGTSGQALVSGGSAAAPAWTTLLSTHISDFTEASQDVIGALLVDSTTIDVTYNDGANSFTMNVIPGGIDHGGLAGLTDDDHTQYVLRSILTTNGDLFTRTAGAVARLGVGTDGQVLSVVSGAPAWADAAAGGGMTKDVTQATHGFSVQDVVYFNGTIYVLADASAESTAEVVGIVSAVADASNFTITMGGHVTGLSGLTAGAVYFLSETAGDLTATEPTTTGAVSKPLLIADSTTSGYFFNMRGQVIGGGVAGVRELTSGTATAGQTSLTVAYTPGYVDVYVNGVRLLDADFTATNGTSIVLDTGMALNDEWVVVVWTVVSLTDTSLMMNPPQGRLTLTTGTPVMTAEAAAQTTIYYTPYVGDLIPLYDGSAWAMKRFAEISIAMAGNAAWASGSVYDLYVYNDGGTIRLVTGAAWTNTTTRSESLTRVNGILTNAATMTGRYGTASTVSIAANRATYVGTFYASANGTTTWELGGLGANGDAGLLYVWNAHNRVLTTITVRDNTNSWTYASATVRAWNNSATNRATFVRGLNEDSVVADAIAIGQAGVSNDIAIGAALDTTTGYGLTTSYTTLASFLQMHMGTYQGLPGIGLHYISGVEAVPSAGVNVSTFYGDAGGTTIQSGLRFTGMF